MVNQFDISILTVIITVEIQKQYLPIWRFSSKSCVFL